METSKKQTLLFTEDKSTSSQGDSLANLTPSQVREKVKTTIDISGLKCYEQYEKLNQGTSWAKTFVACLVGMEDWFSMRCKLTWKMKASKSSRLYFQLQASTPRTKETGYGLLLTPTTREDVVNLETFQKRMEKYPNGTKMPNLATQVSQLLPTPIAGDWKGQKRKDGTASMLSGKAALGMLPTPRTTDVEGGKASGGKNDGNGWYRENKKGERWGVKLRDVAENGMLPTPKVQDERHALRDRGKSNLGEEMAEVGYQRTGTPSHLNPLFCAEMMGFPVNWTVSPFLSGEKNQSKDTATQ